MANSGNPLTRGLFSARTARSNCSFLACGTRNVRSEEHTSELQSQSNLVCRLLLEKKKEIRLYGLAHCAPPVILNIVLRLILATTTRHRPAPAVVIMAASLAA